MLSTEHATSVMDPSIRSISTRMEKSFLVFYRQPIALNYIVYISGESLSEKM